jgi:hypothetical protein
MYLSLCEAGRAQNNGIQRTSPEAQRFVYQTWLTAMKGRRIDLHQVYGFDPSVLEATRRLWWFSTHSEPHSANTNVIAENLMARIVEGSNASLFGNKRQLEPDLCSF